MRNATSAKTSTTAATSRKPISDSPRWARRVPVIRFMAAMMKPRSSYAAAHPLEGETAYVVPVEPDEEGLAPDVVVRDESPVAAVVAVVPVVAHHEIMAGRHLAGKAAVIVFAIVAIR